MENDPNVRVLYKYQTWKEYTYETISNNNIYLSRWAELNDPFDPFFTILKEAHPGIPLGEDENATKTFEIFANASIFSLSENIDNLLLWSHYADTYKGFCIGYAVYINHALRIVHPVKYTDRIPERIINSKCLNTEDCLNLICIKPKEWEYEKEWRFIVGGDNDSGVWPSPFPLVEVVFGYNMNLDNRVSLMKATSSWKPYLKVAQPRIKDGKYYLSIEHIEI